MAGGKRVWMVLSKWAILPWDFHAVMEEVICCLGDAVGCCAGGGMLDALDWGRGC